MTVKSDSRKKTIPSLKRLRRHTGSLWKAVNTAYKRTFEARETVDYIVYFNGRRSIEEFTEILLLCEHGYASGANALLRGMYERAITAMYLSKFPEEADDFLDFHWISQRRLITQLKETFGADILSENVTKDVETNYKRVLEKFQIMKCSECGTKRTNHTWTKLDFVSMAKKAGPLGELITFGYALPTQDAHATVKAILDRLTSDADEVLRFNSEIDVTKIEQVLITAHNIVVAMVELQQSHFNIGDLEGPLQQCLHDFQKIWKTQNATASGH